MHKLILIVFLIGFNLSAASAERLKISIGIIVDLPKSKVQNDAFDIEFVKISNEIKVVNMLVNGKLDMAILPPSYAVKAIWQARTHAITYKLGGAFEYLVSPKNKEKIHISNSESKVIGFVENSGGEFLLDEFLGIKRYKKLYLNSKELESFESLKNVDAVLLDISAFMALPDKENFHVTEVYAGPWVLVAMGQDREIIKKSQFMEIFKNMGTPLGDTTQEDHSFVDRLHKSIIKSKYASDAFDVSNQFRKVK